MNLTDQQRDAIFITDRHLAVDAGAGSGKTFVLIQRMLNLIENEKVDLDAIVAITFTDLAAAEMKERLREAFRKRAEHADTQQDGAAQTFWRDLQRRAETARISTIHSFCSGLLRTQALRCGLDPNFAVITDADAHILLHETVRDTVHRSLNDGDGRTMEAAVMLGATGLRTQVESLVRERYALRELADRVPMGDADGLAEFWRRSAAEMEAATFAAARSDVALRRMRDGLAAFEGLCTNGDDGREVLRERMIAILDAIAAGRPAREIRGAIATMKEGRKQHRKANWPEESADELASAQAACEKKLAGLLVDDTDDLGAMASLSVALYAIATEAADAYDRAKAERNALDFEDLIYRALALLDDPARPVLARTRAGMSHLLIDEFQDTDQKQYRIATLLSRLASGDDGPKLFIVGDAKQSIYGWRGADVSVFKTAQEMMGAAPLPLNQNFRSSPQILSFVNDFFHRTGVLCAVEDPYVPMRWHRPDGAEPAVEIMVIPADSETKVNAAERRESEAAAVAGRIAALCDPLTGLDIVDPDTGGLRKAEARDVAVLLRGRGIAPAYERALQRAGIPYVLEAGPSFYERQEVTDLRNLLTVVADPWNEAALLAFLRSPAVGLSDDDIYLLGTAAPLGDAFHGSLVPDGLAEPEVLARSRELFGDLRARRYDALPDFLDYVLDRTGIEAIWLGQFMGVQKAANVRKVCEMGQAFASGVTPGLGAFVRYLEDVTQREMRESEAGLPAGASGSVTILTIHKSKGLEFPIVVLADLSAGPGKGSSAGYHLHPTWGLAAHPRDEHDKPMHTFVDRAFSALDKAAAAAENMRILYVAMTRARDYLVLPGMLSHGLSRPEKDSVFALLEQTYPVAEHLKEGEWLLTPLAELDGLMPCRIGITTGAPAGTFARKETGAEESVDWARVSRRIGPLATTQPLRCFFAVTEVARAMAGDAVEPEALGAGGRGEADAMLRGTILHGVLEKWDFTSDPSALLEAALAGHIGVPKRAAQLRDDLGSVLAAMTNHDLCGRFRADAARISEAPFMLRIGDAIVEGSIDAVLSDGTIVDFKTGGAHGGASYGYQVQLYALAAHRLRGLEPAQGLLWYVDSGDIHPVDVSAAALAHVEEAAAVAIATLRQPLAVAADKARP